MYKYMTILQDNDEALFNSTSFKIPFFAKVVSFTAAFYYITVLDQRWRTRMFNYIWNAQSNCKHPRVRIGSSTHWLCTNFKWVNYRKQTERHFSTSSRTDQTPERKYINRANARWKLF